MMINHLKKTDGPTTLSYAMEYNFDYYDLEYFKFLKDKYADGKKATFKYKYSWQNKNEKDLRKQMIDLIKEIAAQNKPSYSGSSLYNQSANDSEIAVIFGDYLECLFENNFNEADNLIKNCNLVKYPALQKQLNKFSLKMSKYQQIQEENKRFHKLEGQLKFYIEMLLKLYQPACLLKFIDKNEKSPYMSEPFPQKLKTLANLAKERDQYEKICKGYERVIMYLNSELNKKVLEFRYTNGALASFSCKDFKSKLTEESGIRLKNTLTDLVSKIGSYQQKVVLTEHPYSEQLRIQNEALTFFLLKHFLAIVSHDFKEESFYNLEEFLNKSVSTNKQICELLENLKNVGANRREIDEFEKDLNFISIKSSEEIDRLFSVVVSKNPQNKKMEKMFKREILYRLIQQINTQNQHLSSETLLETILAKYSRWLDKEVVNILQRLALKTGKVRSSLVDMQVKINQVLKLSGYQQTTNINLNPNGTDFYIQMYGCIDKLSKWIFNHGCFKGSTQSPEIMKRDFFKEQKIKLEYNIKQLQQEIADEKANFFPTTCQLDLKISQLTNKATELQQNLIKTQSLLQTSQQKVTDLENAKGTYAPEIETLKHDKIQLQSAIENLRDKIKSLDSEKEQLKKTVKTQGDELKSFQKQKAEEIKKIRIECSNALELMKKEKSALEYKLLNLERTGGLNRNDFSSEASFQLKMQNNKLKKQNQDILARISTQLEEQRQKHQSQLAFLKLDYEAKEKKLNSEIETFKSQNQRMKNESHKAMRLAAQFAQKAHLLIEKNAEIEKLSNQIGELEMKIVSLETALKTEVEKSKKPVFRSMRIEEPTTPRNFRQVSKPKHIYPTLNLVSKKSEPKFDTLNSKIQEETKDKQSLEQNIKQLTEGVQAKQQLVNQIRKQLEKETLQKETQNQRADFLEQQRRNFLKQLTKLKDQNQKIQQQLLSLKKKQLEKNEIQNQEKQEIQSLMNGQKQKQQELQKQIEELNVKIIVLQRDLEAQRLKIIDLESLEKSNKAEIQAHKQAEQQSSETILSLQEEKQQNLEAISSLKSEIEKVQQNNKKLQEQLTQKYSIIQARKNQFQAQIQSI